MIISFEGGEGAGKTTQIRLVCSYLDKRQIPWLSFREPGGSAISEEIRKVFINKDLDPVSELLLILASRKENISQLIEPALSKGKIVLIDRFIDSTLVYQGILGGIGIAKVKEIMHITSTYIEPDITILLDISPEIALARICQGDRFETRPMSYHTKIREAFIQVARFRRHHRVDAARSIEEIHKDIISIITNKIAI